MAADRVFKIGELVEKILLYLPTKELLLSKRINRKCKRAHETNTKIKKALFLEPGVANDTSDDASFPLPRFSASATLLQKWWSHGDYSVPLPAEANDGVSFNPLLVDYFTGQRTAISHNRESAAGSRVRFRKPGKDSNKQWSCHRMSVTQPPLHMMTMSMDYLNARRNRGLQGVYIGDWMKGGMLYGDLVDELDQRCKDAGVSLRDVRNWGVGVRSVYADEEVP